MYAEKANYGQLEKIKQQVEERIGDVDNALGELTNSQVNFENKVQTIIDNIEKQSDILKNSI